MKKVRQGSQFSIYLDISIQNSTTKLPEHVNLETVSDMSIVLTSDGFTLNSVAYQKGDHLIISDPRFSQAPPGQYSLAASFSVGSILYDLSIRSCFTIERAARINRYIHLGQILAESNVSAPSSGVLPDEEDLTMTNSLQLKQKNRTGESYNYTILRKGISLESQLTASNTIYEVRYNFSGETATIPSNSTLLFTGGALLNCNLTLNNTALTGNVVLTGSTLSGSISNSEFNAAWICPMQYSLDDAGPIRQAINVSNRVFFPKGTYYLDSYETIQNVGTSRLWIMSSHKALIGDGAIFDIPHVANSVDSRALRLTTIRVHSVDSTLSDIEISGIEFNTHNQAEDYDATTFQEWSHLIFITAVNRLTIHDCTINDFYGDAICLSKTSSQPRSYTCSNVKVCNNYIKGPSLNNRNGISVVSGEHVSITDNVFNTMSNSHMPGAIDVEPNSSFYPLKDIVIDNNRFINIPQHSIAVGFNSGATGSDVRITNNLIDADCVYGIHLFNKNTETTVSRIQIINNTLQGTQFPFRIYGANFSNLIITLNTLAKPGATIQSLIDATNITNSIIKDNLSGL